MPQEDDSYTFSHFFLTRWSKRHDSTATGENGRNGETRKNGKKRKNAIKTGRTVKAWKRFSIHLFQRCAREGAEAKQAGVSVAEVVAAKQVAVSVAEVVEAKQAGASVAEARTREKSF